MKIAIIGHSHINCMVRAAGTREGRGEPRFEFLQLRDPELLNADAESRRITEFDGARLRSSLEPCRDAVLCALLLRGNNHVRLALLDRGLSPGRLEQRIAKQLSNDLGQWFGYLRASLSARMVALDPPPPIESEDHIRSHPGGLREKIAEHGIAPFELRLHAWKFQCEETRRIAAEHGIPLLALPAAVFSPSGGLAQAFYGADASHGNHDYGHLMLAHVARAAADIRPASAPRAAHPYGGLPRQAFWREAVAECAADELDPVADPRFRIARSDRIATAGSCFAQHIARHLRANGFHHFVTEQETEGSEPGTLECFSARFGNIYTSRQLLQLLERAYGRFTPQDDHWMLPGGRFCDPFRPRIERTGFATLAALRGDRERHLHAVRRMFEELDVFVFTLGLTECWTSCIDGAAYPLAPGVAGGMFDPQQHAFRNLDVDEVVGDMRAFLEQLRRVSPAARVVLTVSPVPLAATRSGDHVLSATTYSKAVLRVAAECIARSCPAVAYFPSYEIIAGSYNRGAYFAADLRSITEAGVAHVMRVFMQRMGDCTAEAAAAGSDHADAALDAEIDAIVEADCDEVLLGDLARD